MTEGEKFLLEVAEKGYFWGLKQLWKTGYEKHGWKAIPKFLLVAPAFTLGYAMMKLGGRK